MERIYEDILYWIPIIYSWILINGPEILENILNFIATIGPFIAFSVGSVVTCIKIYNMAKTYFKQLIEITTKSFEKQLGKQNEIVESERLELSDILKATRMLIQENRRLQEDIKDLANNKYKVIVQKKEDKKDVEKK